MSEEKAVVAQAKADGEEVLVEIVQVGQNVMSSKKLDNKMLDKEQR